MGQMSSKHILENAALDRSLKISRNVIEVVH